MHNHSFLSRFLHWVGLGFPFISEASFDLEKSLFGKDPADCAEGEHVFVCGLARSGTTLLLRRLHQSGEFGSLLYADMPFVLAPNFGASLRPAAASAPQPAERAHGDGVLVNRESPEALDEVFWRIFCGGDYIKTDRLVSMQADEDTLKEYRTYLSLILKARGKRRYLSKNNNNILRLGTIQRACPRAYILVPFRDPLEHAHSLWKQHERFCRMHQENPFARQYMNWLVHREFGLDHIPFDLGSPLPTASPRTLDYWVELWCQVYNYFLTTDCKRVHFLDYADTAIPDHLVWQRLEALLDLPQQTIAEAFQGKPRTEPPQLSDSEMVAKAQGIYQGLRDMRL